MTELNLCKVPRGHKSAELIPNFPRLAHLKLTQTFAKKKETAEFQFELCCCTPFMKLRSSAVICFLVHDFSFLIDLAITSKIFRLLKLINDDDSILVKVGDFVPLLLLTQDFKRLLNDESHS